VAQEQEVCLFLSIRDMDTRKLRFDEAMAPGRIEFYEGNLIQVSDLEVRGTAELISGSEEIHVRGHLKVLMEAECDRCLEATPIAIDRDFDLIYAPDEESAPGEEIEIRDADADIGFYSGPGLELSDVLREQVLLALPMQRVCSESCKGICPACGHNRNLIDCGCHQVAADDRWSVLKDL
jgi:uncharacterized protein